MTRFEKLTLGLSATAVFISVVSPFIIYAFLDPSEKELRQRGVLQDVTTEENVSCDETGHRVIGSSFIEASFRNVGHRQMKDIDVSVAHPASPKGSVMVSVHQHALVLLSSSDTLDVYRFTTAVAPGELIALRAQGEISSIMVQPQTIDPVIRLFQNAGLGDVICQSGTPRAKIFHNRH